jgi:hypothetical protein
MIEPSINENPESKTEHHYTSSHEEAKRKAKEKQQRCSKLETTALFMIFNHESIKKATERLGPRTIPRVCTADDSGQSRPGASVRLRVAAAEATAVRPPSTAAEPGA